MSCRAPRKWVGNWYKLLCGVHLRTVLARQCSSMQQRVQRRPVVNRHGTLVAPFLELVAVVVRLVRAGAVGMAE